MICHGLQFVAEIGDVEIALLEVVEVRRERDGAVLAIAEELMFQGNPNEPGGGVDGENFLEEVGGDGAVKPGEDDAVHLLPIGTMGEMLVGEDMFRQGILAEGDEEEATPLRVVCGGDIQCDRNKSLHVEDADGLGVKGGAGVGVEHRRRRGGVRWAAAMNAMREPWQDRRLGPGVVGWRRAGWRQAGRCEERGEVDGRRGLAGRWSRGADRKHGRRGRRWSVDVDGRGRCWERREKGGERLARRGGRLGRSAVGDDGGSVGGDREAIGGLERRADGVGSGVGGGVENSGGGGVGVGSRVVGGCHGERRAQQACYGRKRAEEVDRESDTIKGNGTQRDGVLITEIYICRPHPFLTQATDLWK